MELTEREYSVLMSVYFKEKADYLRTAMESIWAQTVPTDDFVLVCDGPLTPELDAVIDTMHKAHSGVLQVLRLSENGGLGRALNAGIKLCRHDLVARMDSDDISRPDRCERQLRAFADRPELSLVSGTVEEFSSDPSCVESRRILPQEGEALLAFAKKRNPFNHPCVMYRKSAVEAAGGYQDFYLLEDYFLWIRMLQNGCEGRNLPEPLLWMRAGSDLYRRRSGRRYAASQRKLFRYMRESGFIGEAQYCKSVIIRTVSALIPNEWRAFAYKTILRK